MARAHEIDDEEERAREMVELDTLFADYTVEEAEAVLVEIQRLDPPGVGARSLQESILIQMRQADEGDTLAFRMVEGHFHELVNHRWSDIGRALNATPREVQEAADTLSRFDPNDFPIVSLALTSETLGPAELTRIADPGITRMLRGLSGVAEVQVVGSLERELTVELRPEAMAATGVGVGAVVQAQATRRATDLDQFVQGTDHPAGRQAGVDFDLHRFAVEVVVDVERTEPSARPQGIGHEVRRPGVIGVGRDLQRVTHAFGKASLAAPRQVQPQPGVDPPATRLAPAARLQYLVEQQPKAIAGVVLQVCPHRFDERPIVTHAWAVMPRRTRQSQHAIGTTGAEPVFILHRQAQLEPLRLA